MPIKKIKPFATSLGLPKSGALACFSKAVERLLSVFIVDNHFVHE